MSLFDCKHNNWYAIFLNLGFNKCNQVVMIYCSIEMM